MYLLGIWIRNPVTGEERSVQFQFDPATVTAAKLATAWPQLQAILVDLRANIGPPPL